MTRLWKRLFVDHRSSRWGYLSAVAFSEEESVPRQGWSLNCAGTRVGNLGRFRRWAGKHWSCFSELCHLWALWLGISFLSLSSFACKIFVFCVMECLRREWGEWETTWLCAWCATALLLGLWVWPLAGFTSDLQEYTALLVVVRVSFCVVWVAVFPMCSWTVDCSCW